MAHITGLGYIDVFGTAGLQVRVCWPHSYSDEKPAVDFMANGATEYERTRFAAGAFN